MNPRRQKGELQSDLANEVSELKKRLKDNT